MEKVYSLDRIICLLSMHYFPLLYTTTIRNWHYTFPFVAIFLVVKVSYISSISFRGSLSISLKYSLSFKTNVIELISHYLTSFWRNTPTELLSLLICFWLLKWWLRFSEVWQNTVLARTAENKSVSPTFRKLPFF